MGSLFDIDEYQEWKTDYEADGGTDACIHVFCREKHIEDLDILEVLQHDHKIFAGERSQEKQHENMIAIGQ